MKRHQITPNLTLVEHPMNATHSTLKWQIAGDTHFPEAISKPTSEPGIITVTAYQHHALDPVIDHLIARFALAACQPSNDR